jgi:predicted phosphodiesterase
MSELFRKAAIFGDIHLGLKGNGLVHNEDCLNFIRWFSETAISEGCDICIFLGDYFHNRNNTNLVTMNYGLQGLRILSDSFARVIMITGNHDLYYKDKRTVSSVSWANHIPNIEIINEWTQMGDVIFAPWMVQDEYKKISVEKAKYLMCHAEIPNFLMNAQTAMPEVGEIRAKNFSGFEHVYSGHFHMRQTQGNITYIGNAFPHNYTDAGDDSRGMMILPYGQEPTFLSWPDAPKYRVVKISDLVVDPSSYLPAHSYIKLVLDTAISYEEASYLKETLVKEYELREMSLVPVKKDMYAEDLANGGNISFQSVDSIVQGQITAINSDFYDSNLLLSIYREL